MLDLIKTEIVSWFWLIVGLIILFIGMFMSDMVTHTVDKFFKKD